jgi:hypothetical protein
LRRPASVKATSARSGASGPASAAASVDRDSGRLGVRRRLGCFLDHDVRVCSAHPERADSGPTHPVPLPWAVLASHNERGLVQPQFRVRAGVVQRPGDRLVLQAENRFDQTCDPGGDFQVTDVGLDRSDDARAGPGGVRNLERRSESTDFDRVTERGAGSVGLDIAHGRGIDAGYGVRFGDDIGLSGRVGRRVTHLHRSVVVDRRTADDGVDAIPGVDGGLQRLESHHRDSAAEDRAVGPHVERPAVANRRHH